MKRNTCICNDLTGKRLCVCQVSTDGTVSRGQTGHSDSGQKCTDFTFTSVNDSSSLAHPNLDRTRHLREHSDYNCRHCGSEFKDRNQMLYHVKTMHDGRQFACRQCQRSYSSKGGLTEHVKKMHNNLTRYRCETCRKGFMNRSLYYDHVAAHTGVKRHTCSMCEMRFTNKCTLKTHVKRFHPDEAVNIL